MSSRCACLSRHSAARLSPARTRLVEILRDVSFGRIENLHVRAGEPTLVPPPRIIRTLKLGGGEDAGLAPSQAEIATRPAVQDLMLLLDRMRDGTITRLEIRNACPVFCEVELTGTTAGGPHA
jgi:hypothetical protein